MKNTLQYISDYALYHGHYFNWTSQNSFSVIFAEEGGTIVWKRKE